MIGAIIGDIVGSVYEFDNIKTKEFPFITEKCSITDDSIMTLAICEALMNCQNDYSDLSEKTIYYMRNIGRNYPYCGFGGRFFDWIFSDDMPAYNSFGNGSAMRVSGIAWVANSIEEVKKLSRLVTEISHNHPEGIKGAEATAVATYMARTGCSKEEIRQVIQRDYYPLNFTLDKIRPTYQFNEICQDSVPQAIQAFLESTSFEDAIRNTISIGGDSDTLGAITGAIAEAFYGVPQKYKDLVPVFLTNSYPCDAVDLADISARFVKKFNAEKFID